MLLTKTPSIETKDEDVAACLPLKPFFARVSNFFSNLSPTRRFSHPNSSSSSSACPSASTLQQEDEKSAPSSPYPQSQGTPTFLSLPRPIPTRLHDYTHELDHDVYELPPVTRPRAHSRTPSAFTMFTNITKNFTIPPFDFDRPIEAVPKGMMGRSMIELDAHSTTRRYAVSIASKSGSGCGSGDTCVCSAGAKTLRRTGSEGSNYPRWKGGRRVHVNMIGRDGRVW